MPEEPTQGDDFSDLCGSGGRKELARLRIEQSLVEAERRYRDLFEEAPIAYVHEDLRVAAFIRAKPETAIRILGLRPDEVVGTVGLSLVADTPDNQRRIREAFAAVGYGVGIGGIVLELRRKDNGKPVWVQWWSKPEPLGKYTRTMIVDITERVLMEQEQARETRGRKLPLLCRKKSRPTTTSKRSSGRARPF